MQIIGLIPSTNFVVWFGRLLVDCVSHKFVYSIFNCTMAFESLVSQVPLAVRLDLALYTTIKDLTESN